MTFIRMSDRVLIARVVAFMIYFKVYHSVSLYVSTSGFQTTQGRYDWLWLTVPRLDYTEF